MSCPTLITCYVKVESAGGGFLGGISFSQECRCKGDCSCHGEHRSPHESHQRASGAPLVVLAKWVKDVIRLALDESLGFPPAL